MTEGKKVVKKSALKTPRLKSVIQRGDTAGKVSNVIGKWKMKANKSKETLLVPVEEVKITSAMRNLHRLKIRREDLDKVRQNSNPVKSRRLPPRLQQVVVRRAKKTDKNLVAYAVLKPANEDFVLPPVDVTNYAGPRFDCEGNFISYSILGSLTEFKRVAKERREFNELFVAENAKTAISMQKPGEQHCSSLKLWKDRINEWNEIHRTLSQKSKRPVEDLLMRTPNEYPEIVNQRAVISMASETPQGGFDQKRENANFFKLCNTIGKGDCSVFSTLGKSVTNEYTPVEILQVPDVIDREKGSDTPSLRRGYPVYHTPYLQTRASEILESTHMFIPQAQQLKQLQVVGAAISNQRDQERLNTKLESSIVEPVESQNGIKTGQQDVGSKYPIGFTGPALVVGNQLTKWEGHGLSRQGHIGIKTFVVFDGNQNEFLHNRIRLENVGATRLVFDLTRAPVRNSFDIPRSKVQRFFLLSEGGVLAPGESLLLPVICRSKTAGIFQESWAIKTSPVLDCGSDIIVNFKAKIHSTENYMQKFAKIEEKLLQNKAMTIVRGVVSILVDSICSPAPATPTSEYISAEEQFNAENQGLLYHSSTIRAMENYHSFLIENIPVIPEQYRVFSLSNLRKSIILMTDIEEGELEDPSQLIAEMDEDWNFTKRRLLWRYLRQVNQLGCVWPEPAQNLGDITFMGCRAVLASIFDRFCDRSTSMAVFLNLPMKSDGDQVEKTVGKKNNIKGGKQRSNQVVSKVKKGKDALSPMRARTPTQTPSIVRKSAVSPSMDDQSDDVMESFLPVAKENVEKEKLNFYRGKLHQIMYAELGSAIDKMMMLCDGEI